MRISRFTFVFKSGEHFICFNSTNGKIVKIGSSFYDGQNLIYSTLTDGQFSYLVENHFIVNDDDDEEDFLLSYPNPQETNDVLYITIEITTSCNFSCAFCYQYDWMQRTPISSTTISHLFRLLYNSDLSIYKEINVDFIGGEPFLYKNKVLEIYTLFQELCAEKKKKLTIKLNSNGYYLDAETIQKFEHTTIMLPFLSPQDYNEIVKLKNSCKKENIYQRLFENIQSWITSLNDSDNTIVFRFNVSHLNYDYIPDFFNSIINLGLKHFEVDIVNTANLGNIFVNKLSEDDFIHIYTTTVIPLCKKNHIELPLKPRCAISRCKARHNASFKLFSDGRIGLCNGINYNKNTPLISKLNNLEDINILYSRIKKFHYLESSEKCRRCNYVFLCGGPSPCNSHKCPYNTIHLEKHIKSLL